MDDDFKVDSLDELEFVSRKWKDIENRVEYVAIKIAQMAKDTDAPTNFVIDPDRHQAFLMYQPNKMRVFPVEILLLVPDEGVVEELLKPWLDFVKVDENGTIVKIENKEQ